MDFLTWGRNPWGQQVLTHISWDLLWASLLAGVMFLVAHASYMVLSAHRKRSAAETAALEAAHKDLPEHIERHTFMARMFHWVMAASMFVLLFTAFLPIAGFRFPWVTWHWMAGLVLTASIIYHIVHATFWLDFWSIWVGPKDIPEFKSEIMLELGREVPGLPAWQVPARQQAVSPGDRRRRVRGRDHRAPDDAAHPDAAVQARSVLHDRRDLGLHLRAARPRRRRPGRPGHRARLLRGPARQVVDYQGHDLRVDAAAASTSSTTIRSAGR